MLVHVRVLFLPDYPVYFVPKGNFWGIKLIYQYWKIDELEDFYLPVV